MSKKSSLITEISLDDFLALGLTGRRHRKNHYNTKTGEKLPEGAPLGEWVTDSRGDKHWVTFNDVCAVIDWEQVSLGSLVKEAVEFAKEDNLPGYICVAIHKKENNDNPFSDAYLDKWLTREGPQTYLIGVGISHLYVGKHKFYTKGDYFEFSKRETACVYMIKY